MKKRYHQGTTRSGSKVHAVLYVGKNWWSQRAACGVRISPDDVKQRSFTSLTAGYCERCASSLAP